MIDDRIGNSILYSIKTYIQEIRWDKHYSGRPLTITWTKEATKELSMENRSFISLGCAFFLLLLYLWKSGTPNHNGEKNQNNRQSVPLLASA